MPNVLELKQRASELKNEVTLALKDCEAGKITPAALNELMDKAEAEDGEISKGINAYNRAISWRSKGSAEGDSGGEPPTPESVAKAAQGLQGMKTKQLQANWGQYSKLAQLAKANLSSRGEGVGAAHFDINLRHYGPTPDIMENGLVMGADGIVMKAQGIAGMQGEQTSGTTAPATGPLGEGEYFYPGTAGPAVEPEFIPGIAEMRWYPNVVAGLFPTYPVTSPIVTYVKEVLNNSSQTYAGQPSWNNQAAAVMEGATKPTSSSGISRYTENVGKIANLMRVTDEMIQDAAYFWSLVQRRGVMGVTRKEEVELLAGTGLPGVNGLLNRATFTTGLSYPSGFTTPQTVSPITNLSIGAAVGSGALPDTVSSLTPGRQLTDPSGVGTAEGILQALYDIRVLHFFEPDAVVLNPFDWMTIRLAKDQRGQYLGGSFFGTIYGGRADAGPVGIEDNLSLWSKRVITTPVQPEGLSLVGDFKDAGQVLRLGGLRVDITNTNGFDFEQNLWTMRVEERVGLLVDRPELFELVALAGGS